jgi:hypothetical protein
VIQQLWSDWKLLIQTRSRKLMEKNREQIFVLFCTFSYSGFCNPIGFHSRIIWANTYTDTHALPNTDRNAPSDTE